MDPIIERNEFFPARTGSKIHPSSDRDLTWVRERSTNRDVIVHSIEAQDLPTGAVGHIRSTIHQSPVLGCARGHVVRRAIEGVAGLEIRVDIQRHEGVVQGRDC